MFIFSFLPLSRNNSVDLHLHDTYFVIADTHVIWFLVILSFFIWTIYLATNKILYSKILTWTHVIITVLLEVLFASLLFIDNSYFIKTPTIEYTYEQWNSLDMYSTLMKVTAFVIFILLFGQLIFVVNFIIGIFKRQT